MRFQVVTAAIFVMVVSFLSIAVAQDISPIASPSAGQSSPVTGDLDGDPSNGLETVIGAPNGVVEAIHADGTILWRTQMPNYTCASAPASDKLYTTPVIAKLYGDSRSFVVVGYGGFRGKPCDGGVAALRGIDGSIEWVFSIKKWARRRGFDAFRNAVFGTPAVADIDGDGRMEIGFGAFDRNIYLLNANGSVRWYYNAADTVFSSPVFTDVDGDGRKEMVIGTDISMNKRIKPATPNGGYLYALKAAAKVPRPGYRYLFRSPALQKWRTEFDQVMQSSPVIADLIPENNGLEVVVGSGCFFPQGRGDRRGKWYRVVSLKTGAVLRTLSVTACTPSPAGIGDINGDGVPDVVVSVSGDASAGGDGTSHLIAWTPSTNTVLWDINPRLGARTDRFGGHYNRSPVVADINGDGNAEVLLNYANGIVVVDGHTGQLVSCGESSCTRNLLRSDDLMQGRPAIADTDSDGSLEIIAGGVWKGSAAIIRWRAPFQMQFSQ